jgi:hypothetical protein
MDTISAPRLTGRQRLILLVLLGAGFTVSVDFSILNVALPETGAGVGMDVAGFPWITAAYALPAAGFTLMFGRLADLFGRRRLFMSSMVLLAAALLGDETSYTGPERARVYRWFTDPRSRDRIPEEDHDRHGRTLTARLAAVHAQTGPTSPAGELVAGLCGRSPEFARLWDAHPVLGPYCEPKRLNHPEVGLVELHGQTLLDPDQYQALTVFTAVPGTESAERLRLLAVVGSV